MPRKRQSRTYLKRRRFYGDFRDYADVGGGKEALTPSGHKYATQDPAVAAELVQARIEELERLRRHGVQFAKHGVADGQIRDLTRLGDFVDHHLRTFPGPAGASSSCRLGDPYASLRLADRPVGISTGLMKNSPGVAPAVAPTGTRTR